MNDFTSTYIFKTKDEAEEALNVLLSYAAWYGIVLLSDFKEIVNVEADYMDRNYGWLEDMVRDDKVVSTSDGFRIDIRKAVAIA